ncbi:MAG: DUF4233 domain-containing protein [Nocardioidaceae bacterium]
MRTMAAAVLGFESVVLFLSTPVMIQVSGVEKAVALGVGVGLAVSALLLAALLRFRWAYVAGSVVQVAAVGLGFVVPVMFLLGGVFALFWVMALMLGSRVDAVKAQRAAE